MLKVIPLGGLGEIGLNMMAVEYDQHLLVVDAGEQRHGQGRYFDSRA